MSKRNASSALKEYGKVGVQSAVESASPHRLIQMLMEGALSRIATAVGHMERGELSDKGENIGWAISIIDGLRASLDADAGGDIAANLEQLYDYMTRRLLEANLHNNVSALKEVHGLLREIKSGWDRLGEQIAPAGSVAPVDVATKGEAALG